MTAKKASSQQNLGTALAPLLENHNLRVTAPRLAVLQALKSSPQPLKAYDIIEKLSRPGKTVKPPTVYRALASLEEAGLIHRLESANAYVFCDHHLTHGHGHNDGCCHGKGQEVLFAICDKCSHVQEIEQNLKPSITAMLQNIGFDAARRIFEIRGICADCRKG